MNYMFCIISDNYSISTFKKYQFGNLFTQAHSNYKTPRGDVKYSV